MLRTDISDRKSESFRAGFRSTSLNPRQVLPQSDDIAGVTASICKGIFPFALDNIVGISSTWERWSTSGSGTVLFHTARIRFRKDGITTPNSLHTQRKSMAPASTKSARNPGNRFIMLILSTSATRNRKSAQIRIFANNGFNPAMDPARRRVQAVVRQGVRTTQSTFTHVFPSSSEYRTPQFTIWLFRCSKPTIGSLIPLNGLTFPDAGYECQVPVFFG